MLIFLLEIDPTEPASEISGFSLGDMTLSGNLGTVTSKHKSPDQSMMIFLSAVALLDELRAFLQNKRPTTHLYVGSDTSFQLSFKKHPNNLIEITHRTDPIDIVSPEELIWAVWTGVLSLFNHYIPYLQADDPVTNDLSTSLQEFKRQFSLIGASATQYRRTQ